MTLLTRFAMCVVVVVGIPVWACACDACGCAGGGSSMGLLPLIQRHFIGMRWQYQGFNTLAHGSSTSSTEIFRTLDLWGRWQPHRRVQLIAVLPYSYNTRQYTNGALLQLNGWGDVSAMAQLAILDPRKQSVRNWQHALQIGVGVKLPTGRSQMLPAEGQPVPPSLQPGTGSFDLLVSGFYALKYRNWGGRLEVASRLNSTNKQQYKFGRQNSVGFSGFYTQKMGKISILPNAGLYLENRYKDRENGRKKSETGGYSLLGSVGIDLFIRNGILNLSWKTPVTDSISSGRVKPTARLSASATWLFGGKKSTLKIKVPTGAFPDIHQ